jgi:hypothetical protein
MHPAATTNASSLGFLTVVESVDLGLLGGYLLLNPAGRPLEFHCTAPVKPTRTQEILYGPTLKPFLYGEQIGQALLAKSKLTPIVVCTNCEAMLAAREFAQMPLALVVDGAGAGNREQGTGDRGHFTLATNQVFVAPRYLSDEQAIRGAWPAQADHLDLLEPFARIREALDEAQRAARQAA